MTTPTTQKPHAAQPERRAEPVTQQLSHRYGTIGIQAVAAAARYADRRKSAAHAQRIDQRFVESAV